MSIPVVTFNETARVKHIDAVLDRYELYNKNVKDNRLELREAILNHPECNVILSLLDEFLDLINPLHPNKCDKVNHISLILAELDSPLIPWI